MQFEKDWTDQIFDIDLMELGFSGKTRVSSKQWENILFIKRLYVKRPLKVVRSEEEMLVTTWSDIATGETPR